MVAVTIAIAGAVYVYLSYMLPDRYFTITGNITDIDVFYGGCQHTDFCNIYFEDRIPICINPSIEFLEFLPLNETYTFHLRYDNNSDGRVLWCDKIDATRLDTNYKIELWRSCRYEE